jgi:hypothetical protein
MSVYLYNSSINHNLDLNVDLEAQSTNCYSKLTPMNIHYEINYMCIAKVCTRPLNGKDDNLTFARKDSSIDTAGIDVDSM